MNPPLDALPESRTSLWVTLLAALGCFLIFAVVLYLAYLPRRQATVQIDVSKIPAEEQWKYSPAGRQAHLVEMQNHERAVQGAYAWIDRAKGEVRLPIDRAMELTIRDLNNARKP